MSAHLEKSQSLSAPLSAQINKYHTCRSPWRSVVSMEHCESSQPLKRLGKR
jgi:hypothetical protein